MIPFVTLVKLKIYFPAIHTAGLGCSPQLKSPRNQVWTVMFNAMCPAQMAASGSYATWQGNLCSGTEARNIEWDFGPAILTLTRKQTNGILL